MIGLGVAELDDVPSNRALARVQAEAGGTRLLARVAFHREVEGSAPRSRSIGVAALTRLECQVHKRAILVSESPVHAMREDVAVTTVGLPPTGVHAETGRVLQCQVDHARDRVGTVLRRGPVA